MDMASSNSAMDPNPWGKLQRHIVEKVYLRLPLWSFFQLRGVCKAWNTLAKQRRSFTERVQKPYFIIVYPVTCPEETYDVGILTLQIASGQWRWNRLPVNCSTQLNPDFVPFSVNGLVFFQMTHWFLQIYDTHTKQRHTVVRSAEVPEGPRVVAMRVNTSDTPFKVQTIIGGLDVDTSINTHSFRSWSTMTWPSRIPTITGQTWPTCMKSCVQWDDCVYTWWRTTTIQVYSLQEDEWTTLNPPENDGVGGALGCWDNRVFVVMEDGELSVSVWELVDEARQAWRPFARIPGEMYSWLVASAEEEPILASFCDRYVLMYTSLSGNNDREGIHDHFVLFDLATKQWEKASLWDNTQSNSDDRRRLREHAETSGRRHNLILILTTRTGSESMWDLLPKDIWTWHNLRFWVREVILHHLHFSSFHTSCGT